MKNSNNINVVPSDNPIRNSEGDVLGRADVAKSFARHVLALDVSEGTVVGVLGPWGSGKTSFINLARTEFQREEIQVLDFNPWMFSDAEHLVERFFIELTSQLRIRSGLDEVGKALEDYSEIVSSISQIPVVGPWSKLISMIMKLLGELIQYKKGQGVNSEKSTTYEDLIQFFQNRKEEGVIKCRKKVREALNTLDKPIIVVLDDVDRLPASEIRDVFKLVRLTASFPNIIYIVACDRFRVEQALEDQGLSGRDYLEKILQLPFDLPEVPNHILHEQLRISINGILAGIEDDTLDEKAWPDIFMEIVQPLIRNMRDVRRYIATVRGTVIGLDDRVALADVFGLEVVRVFLPDIFKLLPGVIDSLTVPSTSRNADRCTENMWEEMVPPERKTWRREQVERLVEAGKSQRGVVEAMLNHLFPAGMQYINGDMPAQENQWEDKLLGARRVAHEDILRLYMERVVGGDLPAHYDAERAFTHMSDRNALDQFIRSLKPERWQDVIYKLSNLEFHRKHVEPGLTVLFNLFPEFPDNSRSRYPVQKTVNNITLNGSQAIPIHQVNRYARGAVNRCASRLLSVLENPAEIKAVLSRIIPDLKSLYSKTELVRLLREIVKQRNDDSFLSETEIAEFEDVLLKGVLTMSADDLARERNLVWDLNFITGIANRLDLSFIDKIDNTPEVTLAVFPVRDIRCIIVR